MFSVREAVIGDAGLIGELLVRSARFAYADIGSPEYLAGLNADRVATKYVELFESTSDEWRVIFALENDVPLGFAEIEKSANDKSLGKSLGILQRMFFVPESLGRGLGPVLHEEVLRVLSIWGCTRAELTYIRGNDRARAFYLKSGWRETGEKRPFDDHGRTLIDVVMERIIY